MLLFLACDSEQIRDEGTSAVTTTDFCFTFSPANDKKEDRGSNLKFPKIIKILFCKSILLPYMKVILS
jgi:hypothetical protein